MRSRGRTRSASAIHSFGARLWGLLGVAVLLAACGSSGAPITAPTAPPSSTGAGAPTPARTGSSSLAPATPGAPAATPGAPATATFSFGGDPHLNAGLKLVFIKCGYPTIAGRDITVFGTASDAMDGFALTATADKLSIRVAFGKGSTYQARQFESTALTGFDALKGFTFSGPVTEVAIPGVPKGGIPRLISMKATVDCAGDTPGSASLHVKGSLPEGEVDADMDLTRVECDTGMGVTTIIVQGIMTIGGKPTAVTASVNSQGTSQIVFQTPTFHNLLSAPGTGGTVAPPTGTWAGDAIAQPSNNIPKLTMTLTGTATCGSSVTF